MKLVTISEMHAIEEEANKKGVSYEAMMDRAGKGVADFIQSYYGNCQPKVVTAIVGSGNNGGDALVALSYLQKKGWEIRAFLAKERDDPLVTQVKECGGTISVYDQKKSKKILEKWLNESAVLIDGLLGTGIKLPIKDPYLSILKLVKQSSAEFKIVAVDCPSGINCDSGETAENRTPRSNTGKRSWF